MKICIIGAGAQGSVIAKILAQDPEIDKVLLTDINTRLLQRVAKSIDNSKLSIQRVDASNMDALSKALRGADVAVNATLPYYNLSIFHSALKNGANYMDFAEDWPMREKFAEQLKTSEKWKEAGLTAVKHQGITPGVTNLLARYAADHLDKVEEIHIKTAWRNISEEQAVVPTWSPGWSVEIALLEWAADVVTLPKFIGKGLKYVDIKMDPDIIAGILINLGLAGTELIEVRGVKVRPLDVLLKLTKSAIEMTQEWKKTFEDRPAELQSCIAAQVKGKKGGQQVQEYVYLSTSESDVHEWLRRYGTTNCWVPIPAATTAKMLAKGEIQIKGVIAPECLEPKPFLRELSKMGIGRFHRITEKQVAA